MTEKLNRHLAAVMFTDVAGYTALMQRDEQAALRTRRRHRAALERSVEGRSGKVMQYFGDGSLSIFSSSFEAVEAAVDIQRELQGDPALRIGLHAGDIAYDIQGAYGDAINVAARLEALCPPGGVTISQKIYDDIRRHPDLEAVPSGTVRLKNVAGAVPTYAISVEGLAVPEAPLPPDAEPALPPSEALAAHLARVTSRQLATPNSGSSISWRVPLVGRERELAAARTAVEAAEAGSGSCLFLRGPHGIGKSRLSAEVTAHVLDRGWSVLRGRAHPSERLVPFSPFTDALMPLVSGVPAEALELLTPFGDEALRAVCPMLGRAPARAPSGMPPGDSQARIFWQFTAMIGKLAERTPLLLVLEDMDFADRASLGLLEFTVRQARTVPLVILVEHSGASGTRSRSVAQLEHEVVTAGAAHSFTLAPLTEGETLEYVRRGFDLPDEDADLLAGAVYEWSRGNPFFVKGTLSGLLESGRLRQEDGSWSLTGLEGIELPHSVRDAVLVWLSGLSEAALDLARTTAMLARPASYELLCAVSGLEVGALQTALDELVRNEVLVESEDGWTLVYAFRHRAMNETLRGDLPLAVRREMHARLGTALETFYGSGADDRAEELAYHFGRAHPGLAGPRTIRYLRLAGERALAVHADREARQHLQEALDRADAAPPGREAGRDELSRVLHALARVRRRLGDTDGAVALLSRLLAAADTAREGSRIASLHREIGVAQMTGGQLDEAIVSFGAAAEWASGAADVPLTVYALLPQAHCYQASGQPELADEVLSQCSVLAGRLDDTKLMGRVFRARVQLDIWMGRVHDARGAAQEALRLGRAADDLVTEFRSRWAMAALEGLLGNTGEMARHIESARLLARDAPSPFFHLAIAELEVELAYATGAWPEGIGRAQDAIDLARSLEEKLVLPRLLVWVSLIHLGRGDIDLADRLTAEAWEVSGAARLVGPRSFFDLHAVVPAHIGRASVALARGEWSEAIRIASLGLEIADRSGYVVWSIHRLLPIMAEASIHSRDLTRAREVGVRMREEADRVGHPLGLAWAEACDAILAWLEGDARAGARSLRRGADAMAAIPLRYDEARIRRQLAGRLSEIGEIDAARSELRAAFAQFERMGARPEMEKSRDMATELGMELEPGG